ncbi:hypothetical protein [Piscinibacter sp. XHJ-5]|uniref:hypothetical protein n=1 Tax=Piscinibacter sp. XHJ-5 TaxID=3037797 RepID=UPI0024532FB7|nr:hypothetical protein [Piscinibacter sp. XHJ-5]
MTFSRHLLWKLPLAAALLAVLAAVAAAELAPAVPLATVLLSALGGAMVLLALLCIAVIVMGSRLQAILRRGGSDTQWLWFGAEPPGLARLRDRSKARRRDGQSR